MSGVAVDALHFCPHVETNVKSFPSPLPAQIKVPLVCQSCTNDSENWICLECFHVACGRHANGHMLEHNTQTGHAVVCGLDDLSFWCYKCESYLHHTTMDPILRAYVVIHKLKFGAAPTMTMGQNGRLETSTRKPLTGADTAYKTKEEFKEFFDGKEEFENKMNKMATWIKEAKHVIVFTGAGISTSAGIPDYRSGVDTVLDTGAGGWTIAAEEKKARETGQKFESKKRARTVAMDCAIPTPTHMALIQLHKIGKLQHVISQNVDGLHRRSGIPSSAMSELHGNGNLEVCTKCHREYLRDYMVKSGVSHLTNNRCACGGALRDTIINFEEQLPADELEYSYLQSFQADLCIVLGTSCRVRPASDLPKIVAKNGKRLVIVNLQATPLDSIASLRVNAKTDDFCQALMQKLSEPVPEFTLCRRVQVTSNVSEGETKLNIAGVDFDGTPASNFQGVHVEIDKTEHVLNSEPFSVTVPTPKPLADRQAVLTLDSFGHYLEPETSITVHLPANGTRTETFDLRYSPAQHKWATPTSVPTDELKAPRTSPGKAVVRDLKAEMRKMMLAGFDPKAARVVMRQIAGADLGEFFETQFRNSVKDLPSSNGSGSGSASQS